MEGPTRLDSIMKRTHPFAHPRTCLGYSNCIFLRKYYSCNQGVRGCRLATNQKVRCSNHSGRTTLADRLAGQTDAQVDWLAVKAQAAVVGDADAPIYPPLPQEQMPWPLPTVRIAMQPLYSLFSSAALRPASPKSASLCWYPPVERFWI